MNTGVSLQRLMLSFLVIATHFCSFGENFLFDYIRRLAVPCFMILSFYFCSQKIESVNMYAYWKRISRFLIPMIGWGGIYYIFYKIIGRDLSLEDLFWQCITGHSYNETLWFLATSIIVTTIIYLLFIIKKPELRNIFLIMLFFVCFVLQYQGITVKWSNYLTPELETVVTRIPEMLPFAIIGLMIKKCQKYLPKKWVSYFSAIMFFAPFIIYTLPLVDPPGFMYQGYSVFLGSLTISIAFIILPIKNIKFVDYLSKYTLGVYCIHKMVGETVNAIANYMGYEISQMGACIVIFAISFLGAIIMGQIPVIKKLVC